MLLAWREVSFLAVLISAIFSMIFGFFWYGPLFGKAWMKVVGKDMADKAQVDEMKKGMTGSYVLTFVGSFVSAAILAAFVKTLGADTFGMGMRVGFWVWLGFVVTIKISDSLFSGKTSEQKKLMFWINAGYYFIQFLIVGGFLARWYK